MVNAGMRWAEFRLLRGVRGMYGFEELIQLLASAGVSFVDLIESNFDPVKAASISFAALSALTGIWIKWRNSGYRQVDRLREFLAQQDKRLEATRASLHATFQNAHPQDSHPAFDARKLSKRLRHANWGYGESAANDLRGAMSLCQVQAELSASQAQEQRKRQALAHLLQGARLAARTEQDDQARHQLRSEAESHFRAAYLIDPTDADALEYSLLMLLEMANPHGVLQEIDKLERLRKHAGGLPLARAFRLRASAYERLPLPRLGKANATMNSAIQAIPTDCVLERAYFNEHQGRIRKRLANMQPGALRSLRDAQSLYASLSSTPEGKAGMDRTQRLIDEVNRSMSATADVDTTDQSTNSEMRAPVGAGRDWLKALSRQSG